MRIAEGRTEPYGAMNVIRRIILLGLLLAGLSACTRWQQLPSVPPLDALARPIAAARVTPRQTGEMVVLFDVRITADSVIGWRKGDPDPSGLLSGPRRRMALHRDDVLVFERSAPNRGAGAAVVAVVTLVVVVSFAVLHAAYPSG
jgi:hypothetical protein